MTLGLRIIYSLSIWDAAVKVLADGATYESLLQLTQSLRTTEAHHSDGPNNNDEQDTLRRTLACMATFNILSVTRPDENSVQQEVTKPLDPGQPS